MCWYPPNNGAFDEKLLFLQVGIHLIREHLMKNYYFYYLSYFYVTDIFASIMELNLLLLD